MKKCFVTLDKTNFYIKKFICVEKTLEEVEAFFGTKWFPCSKNNIEEYEYLVGQMTIKSFIKKGG